MTQPQRPPIPTREEVAAAHVGIPGPALLRFVAQMQPHRHNLTAGHCVGKAPLFDTDQLQGETRKQQAHRLAHAAQLCQTCPVLNTCADNIPDKPIGIWAGTPYRKPRPGQRKTAA